MTTLDSYDKVQAAVDTWQARNFPDTKVWHFLAGMVEEVGEFYAAVTSHDRADAIGDIGVYTAALCANQGWSLATMVAEASHLVNSPNVICHCGVLMHAALKRDQGIRGYDRDDVFRPEVWAHAVGVTYYALHWAAAGHRGHVFAGRGLDTAPHLAILGEVASRVVKRNWRADPQAGSEVAP